MAVGTLTIDGVAKQIDTPFGFNGKITDPWGNSRLGTKASLILDQCDRSSTWEGQALERSPASPYHVK